MNDVVEKSSLDGDEQITCDNDGATNIQIPETNNIDKNSTCIMNQVKINEAGMNDVVEKLTSNIDGKTCEELPKTNDKKNKSQDEADVYDSDKQIITDNDSTNEQTMNIYKSSTCTTNQVQINEGSPYVNAERINIDINDASEQLPGTENNNKSNEIILNQANSSNIYNNVQQISFNIDDGTPEELPKTNDTNDKSQDEAGVYDNIKKTSCNNKDVANLPLFVRDSINKKKEKKERKIRQLNEASKIDDSINDEPGQINVDIKDITNESSTLIISLVPCKEPGMNDVVEESSLDGDKQITCDNDGATNIQIPETNNIDKNSTF
ncbi:probable serine/threonine-protein kinase fhkE [Aphidius gifuensis]|uniref:probable serine/threonine-protein kinase fhkE n=1 Tax=Aphidius gifuensis TaxID=684658 RepID=UPI001CDBE5B4|nr:probable serine/threonine-protein kinase fhkE [Aphidius gifuensis]